MRFVNLAVCPLDEDRGKAHLHCPIKGTDIFTVRAGTLHVQVKSSVELDGDSIGYHARVDN